MSQWQHKLAAVNYKILHQSYRLKFRNVVVMRCTSRVESQASQLLSYETSTVADAAPGDVFA